MEETKCIVCGSTNISRLEYRRFDYDEESGKWIELEDIEPDYECNDCGHDWE